MWDPVNGDGCGEEMVDSTVELELLPYPNVAIAFVGVVPGWD